MDETGPDEQSARILITPPSHNLTGVGVAGIREMLACQRITVDASEYERRLPQTMLTISSVMPTPPPPSCARGCRLLVANDRPRMPLFDSKRGNNFSLMVHKDSRIDANFRFCFDNSWNSIDACFCLCFRLFRALLLCQKIRVHPRDVFHPCRRNFNYFFRSIFELSRIFVCVYVDVCVCVWYFIIVDDEKILRIMWSFV